MRAQGVATLNWHSVAHLLTALIVFFPSACQWSGESDEDAASDVERAIVASSFVVTPHTGRYAHAQRARCRKEAVSIAGRQFYPCQIVYTDNSTGELCVSLAEDGDLARAHSKSVPDRVARDDACFFDSTIRAP